MSPVDLTYWEAILFGLVQGLTEFLPVSSTAHLIFAEKLLGHTFPGLAFEIWLHLASILAVIFYLRRDIRAIVVHSVAWLGARRPADYPHFRFGVMIIIATFITGVIGVGVKDFLDEYIKSSTVIGFSLIVTGIALIAVERMQHGAGRGVDALRWSDSVWVGLAQALAVLPGISRSGSTLVAALAVGLDKDTAVRYSFLLAIPVILGSAVIGARDLAQVDLPADLGPFAAAFAVTFAASVIGIVWLLNFVRKQRLTWFAVYCFIVGPLAIFAGMN